MVLAAFRDVRLIRADPVGPEGSVRWPPRAGRVGHTAKPYNPAQLAVGRPHQAAARSSPASSAVTRCGSSGRGQNAVTMWSRFRPERPCACGGGGNARPPEAKPALFAQLKARSVAGHDAVDRTLTCSEARRCAGADGSGSAPRHTQGYTNTTCRFSEADLHDPAVSQIPARRRFEPLTLVTLASRRHRSWLGPGGPTGPDPPARNSACACRTGTGDKADRCVFSVAVDAAASWYAGASETTQTAR